MRAIALAACALLAPAACMDVVATPAGSKFSEWSESARNPLIRIGDGVPSMVWNDPSVLEEAGGYRMWLSGGNPRDPDHIVVDVYHARSTDGVSWTIDKDPVLRPGPAPGAWDALRVETPTVVKVGATYHLYYSGFDAAGARIGSSAIGHATSGDGIHWTKDPRNPILRAQTGRPDQWGFYGVGEPGIVYDPRTGTFYLYYVSMRHPRAKPQDGEVGILLATSKDGSVFTEFTDASGARAPVLAKVIANAIPGAWYGYSTPAGLITDDGTFHLFCSLMVAPKGPATARNVTLVHAISRDGRDFRVIEDGFFEAGRGDWKDHQVRSPTALSKDGQLRLWFAGESMRPWFAAGIGTATRANRGRRAPTADASRSWGTSPTRRRASA